MEIGNTGSKTTIARYLKQLESPGLEANPRERMSGALRGVVESLLDQVQEEGSQAFLEARAEFEHERKLLVSRAEALESELDELKLRFRAQGDVLAAQTEELKTTQSTLQTEITRTGSEPSRVPGLSNAAGADRPSANAHGQAGGNLPIDPG
ncbi:DNA-binding protein [Pseudomonas fortuita]|uniref:DNA-binding protein n=1 Tax=Pseudomonas fortuita TaxID=3233375 RepID=UPI003DA1B50A